MKLLITYIPFQVLLGVFLGITFPVFNIHLVTFISFIVISSMFTIHKFIIKGFFLHLIFFTMILVLGMILSWCSQIFNNEISCQEHYIHALDKEAYLEVSLSHKLSNNNNYHRFYGFVNTINDSIGSGKILIEIPVEISRKNHFEIGDVLLCKSRIKKINSSVSPYDFNYQKYLENQHVYGKIQLKTSCVKIGEEQSILIKIKQARAKVINILNQSSMSKATVGLMKAMLLGDRKGVSSEVLNSFTNAGVVHIIAISGMHIVVLYFVLFKVFKFVKKIKYGDYLYVGIILICLWGFAIFSGLSSSVTRSVTMFSFFTLAQLKKGERLGLEPIVTSMLILLLVDTNYIYNIGFQLSYSAVIAIVVFYPLFTKWVKVKYKLGQYFIDVLVVSIIAQLGVLPLSLYYFHQIPLQFLVANFFAVSLLPLVLYGGILLLVKLCFSVKSSFIEILYDDFITYYIEIIQYLSSWHNWILKEIYLIKSEVLYCYVFLFCFWYLFSCFSVKRMIQSLILIIVCQLILWIDFYHQTNDELIVYRKYSQSMIVVRLNDELMVLNKNVLSPKDSVLLKENLSDNKIIKIECVNGNLFDYKKNLYLLINENRPYYLLKEKEMILIVGNNPKINFERLIKSLSPKLVIIEGDNYKSNQLKWKSTCKNLQVPFYNISDEGFYQIN